MSNDISIRVNNATNDRNLYIVMFQKPTHANPDIIYTSLFPVAWQVLPLGPQQSCDPVIYPVQLQLSVTESEKFYNSVDRKTIQNVNFGEVWDFNLNGEFSEINQDAGETAVDGVVVMRNNSVEHVDAGLARNGSLVATQKRVAQGEQADFQLTPSLYMMAASNLQKGDIIRSYQITQNVHEIDLTNLKSVDVTVSTADPNSGLLKWTDSNKQAAS